MQSSGSDMGYFLGGALIGGFAAGMFALSNPELPVALGGLISLLGVVFGLALGYAFAASAKADQQKRIQQVRQQRIEQTTSPQVVGKKCRDCNSSIMFINDGHVCPACRHVVCLNCQPSLPCTQCSSDKKTANPNSIV